MCVCGSCADYKLLGILKRQFPKVPLLGLTATATSSVLKDCEKILCVPQPITISASFNRTNLYYEVVTMATALTHTFQPPASFTNTHTHTLNVKHSHALHTPAYTPFRPFKLICTVLHLLTKHKTPWTCYSDANSLLVSQVRIKDSNSDASISDVASLIKDRYKDQSGTAADVMQVYKVKCIYSHTEPLYVLLCVPQGSCMCSLRRMLSQCHLNSRRETSWPIPTTLTWTLTINHAFTASGPPIKSRYLEYLGSLCFVLWFIYGDWHDLSK